MAYAGYLIKVGGAGGTTLPLSFFAAESYTVTPDQRMDVDSGRDTTGLLHRTVATHTASKIELETVDNLTDTQVAAINSLLGLTGSQRNVTLYYFDPESSSYKSGSFYVPDVKYPIRKADSTAVRYMPIRYAFIEY